MRFESKATITFLRIHKCLCLIDLNQQKYKIHVRFFPSSHNVRDCNCKPNGLSFKFKIKIFVVLYRCYSDNWIKFFIKMHSNNSIPITAQRRIKTWISNKRMQLDFTMKSFANKFYNKILSIRNPLNDAKI